MMANTYGDKARLLPLSRNENIKVAAKYARVTDGANGHYAQWVEAAIAGHGKKELSSPFEIAGPLTEALLMANLAIRGFDLETEQDGKVKHPGRYIKLLWDNDNMKITNLDQINQFVKSNYREGWANLTL